MPIYEFKCKSCGAEFEALVRNPQSTAECPECKSDQVARRMSAPASHSNSDATPCGSDCGGEHVHSCGCGCGCRHAH